MPLRFKRGGFFLSGCQVFTCFWRKYQKRVVLLEIM